MPQPVRTVCHVHYGQGNRAPTNSVARSLRKGKPCTNSSKLAHKDTKVSPSQCQTCRNDTGALVIYICVNIKTFDFRMHQLT